MNDTSTVSANSPPNRRTLAVSWTSFRRAGRVAASPFSARLTSAQSSSRLAGTAASVGAVVFDTSSPPFPSVVATEARRQQGGTHEQVGQFGQVVQRGVEGRDFVVLGLQEGTVGLPLLPVDRIHLRGQLADWPAPDVLPDHSAVLAPGPGVVPPALIPPHSVTPPRMPHSFGVRDA